MNKRTQELPTFEAGEIVYLKSDIKCINPMTVETDSPLQYLPDYEGRIFTVRIDQHGGLKKEDFAPLQLKRNDLKAHKTENFEKMPLYHWKEGNVFGMKIYSSLLGANWAGQPADSDEKQTRFVYDFKKYFSNKNEIDLFIRATAFYFDCTGIAAVPPHKVEQNNLQFMYGTHFERIAETLPRKQSHTKPLQADYAQSIRNNFSTIKGKRVLLVDDVVTSGTTLAFFANELEQAGFEVVKFSIGITLKLRPQTHTNLLLITP